MANSPKFTSFQHVANAPAGHSLPHAMTLPALSSKSHKHFQSQSHSHDHVATPYPVLEHSSTSSSVGSDSSTGSTDYMQSHKHHHHHLIHRASIPNPVHAVQDHVSEFRYGHTARSAKREASQSSSTHPWSLDASLAKRHESIDEQYEEVIEDWRERDEKAWAEELKKREKARRSYGSVSADKAAEEQR